jgi:hypothetical protein
MRFLNAGQDQGCVAIVVYFIDVKLSDPFMILLKNLLHFCCLVIECGPV